MGDRRIAEIRTQGRSLYFYTHWSGSTLPTDAQQALNLAGTRRDDLSYAMRRVIDHLILSSGSRDNEVGSGIMFEPYDEDDYGTAPSVTIDLDTWEVQS
jgi:hypothetical protein